MSRLPVILGVLLIPSIVLADPNAGFNAGKAVGQESISTIQSNIRKNTDVIPMYGTTPPEASYFQGGKGSLSPYGVAKVQSCATGAHDPKSISGQECEAVNLLANNPNVRPQFNISSNDPMFKKARDIQNNAPELFAQYFPGFANASSSQCTTKTITTPPSYTTETCSSVMQVGVDQCTMGRIIDIDADSNFQCEQTINAYETLKCRRRSSLTCTGGGDGCNRGGIVPNSWAGDMKTSWFSAGGGNYILEFGTIGDNYWRGGGGTVFDRTLYFEVRDVNLISLFSLTRATFDDWLLVQVNGYTVYIGPYGGDRLLMNGGRVQYCETCFGRAELDRSWNFYLNIDLRPYLRNGSNTIFTRTIVGGRGESAIQITARQWCPMYCSVSTANECSWLESRSQ